MIEKQWSLIKLYLLLNEWSISNTTTFCFSLQISFHTTVQSGAIMITLNKALKGSQQIVDKKYISWSNWCYYLLYFIICMKANNVVETIGYWYLDSSHSSELRILDTSMKRPDVLADRVEQFYIRFFFNKTLPSSYMQPFKNLCFFFFLFKDEWQHSKKNLHIWGREGR